jgi:predicted CopG family antitoxin
MATKSLTITEDAYERLKSHKRDEESFSEVIERLTGADEDIWKGFGAYPDSAERAEERIEQHRREYREDTAERHDELFGQ